MLYPARWKSITVDLKNRLFRFWGATRYFPFWGATQYFPHIFGIFREFRDFFRFFPYRGQLSCTCISILLTVLLIGTYLTATALWTSMSKRGIVIWHALVAHVFITCRKKCLGRLYWYHESIILMLELLIIQITFRDKLYWKQQDV